MFVFILCLVHDTGLAAGSNSSFLSKSANLSDLFYHLKAKNNSKQGKYLKMQNRGG